MTELELVEPYQSIAEKLGDEFTPPGWGTWTEIVCEFPEGMGCHEYLSARYRVTETKAKAILRMIREAQR